MKLILGGLAILLPIWSLFLIEDIWYRIGVFIWGSLLIIYFAFNREDL